jgi:hypothetical protein
MRPPKLTPEQIERRRQHYETRQAYYDAKATRASTYEGPECPKPGHGRRRYTASRQCAACKIEYEHLRTRGLSSAAAAQEPSQADQAPRAPVFDPTDERALLALLAAGV